LPTIKRAVNNQDKQDINYALDSNLQRNFNFGRVNYDVMVGLDMMKERSDYYRRTDTINSFNADNPSYGITSVKLGTPTQELTYSQYAGLYLRNTIKIDDNWIIGLSGRHDWTQVEIDNILKNTTTQNSDQAFTGSASVMYRINDMFAPYISYATSFMPVTDTGANGELLDPEGYIPTAKVMQSVTESEIGKRANHVPKNAGTLSTQYYFSPDKLGWNIGAGIRYQGLRTAQRGTAYIELPGYTVFDVNAGYEAKHWGAGLTIKNFFDREYLAGTTPNAQLVNWGDPRMIRLNVKFKY